MKTIKKLDEDNCCGKRLKIDDPRRKKISIKKTIKKRINPR